MGKYRCAVFKEKMGDLVIEERDIPTPGNQQVLIKVEACGMCHSDVFVKVGAMGNSFPRVPGHEVAGVVESVGEGVDEDWKGKRVGVGWFGGACFKCDNCRRGNFVLCSGHLVCGISYDGGYGEYMVAPLSALARIPDSLSSVDAAPLLCAGITTFNSLRNSGVRAGDNVVVLGIGGLGHLALQFSAKMGCNTIAVSSGDSKRDLAIKLGAHVYIDSSKQNAVEEITKLGGARVILATATNSKVISDLAPALGVDGTLVVLSAEPEPITISPLLLISKRCAVKGWPSGSSVESEDTMNFSALTNITPMVEETSLDNVGEAFGKMLQNKARFRMVIKY